MLANIHFAITTDPSSKLRRLPNLQHKAPGNLLAPLLPYRFLKSIRVEAGVLENI